jgi:hypothetical protein
METEDGGSKKRRNGVRKRGSKYQVAAASCNLNSKTTYFVFASSFSFFSWLQ